jgi:predicted aspartyl protease
MILSGRIDEKNQLWLKITVAGKNDQRVIDVLLDTGFTGDLQLPISLAVPLGLNLRQ